MVSYVLDASALLRFLLNQVGATKVLNILEEAQADSAVVSISAVNWGEVVGKVDAAHGRFTAQALTASMLHYGLEIISADSERAEQAALLKRDWKLGYADAFCVELALSNPGSILLTADFDFSIVGHLTTLELLPRNADLSSRPLQ